MISSYVRWARAECRVDRVHRVPQMESRVHRVLPVRIMHHLLTGMVLGLVFHLFYLSSETDKAVHALLGVEILGVLLLD